jgi:P4 family phage/plasmid primase-like protien
MTAVSLTAEEAAALDVARALAAAGIPVFVAQPDVTNATGFALPRNWQHATPDPRVVDQWRPGMAIAAVMGHGLDVIDVDPRNGGDPTSLNGRTPVSYGAAFTPSGGVHSFIKSLGVRKRSNVLPGIDIQAGAPDGSGRGFVFLAPTVRVSKTTGTPVAYRWAATPDLERWRAAGPGDVSGLALAELVRGVPAAASAGVPSADEFMRSGPWANIEQTLTQGRNNGVARLAASLRGRGGWRLDDALRYMYAEVWPLIDQTQGGHPFAADEFEATIAAQFKQYPDGEQQRAAEAAVPPQQTEGGPIQPPSLLRYFTEKNSLQAATLAADVASLGPLADGADERLWSYHGGVWRSAKNIVRDRVTFLLGERYRSGHVRNVEDIVRSRIPRITCDPIPDIVNVRNGLLDWRTGRCVEHTPEVLSTVQLGVDYDPDADCPAFEQFLHQVVPADVVDTVWELVGYLMYSGNPLHKAVMLTGTGRNGKGTFLRVMVRCSGAANITSVSLHDLVNTRFTTASLFGKLANIAGDIDGGYLENTATLKGITGGDMISAEHKGRDRFDFVPVGGAGVLRQPVPSSADTTVGYLSRWLIVNFPHDFTGREDRSLDAEAAHPGRARRHRRPRPRRPAPAARPRRLRAHRLRPPPGRSSSAASTRSAPGCSTAPTPPGAPVRGPHRAVPGLPAVGGPRRPPAR